MLTYKQKLEQANREALATVFALVVTVVVWAVCGFGLAGLDVQLFHTPLWVVGGTLGTWACAIAVAVVLSRRFFADFDLDDEGGDSVRLPERHDEGGDSVRLPERHGEGGEPGSLPEPPTVAGGAPESPEGFSVAPAGEANHE